MGIGEWFGFGRKPEPEPELEHRAPTSQDLLEAVDLVEQQARDGKVPGMVQSRLGRVARTVRDTVPRLDTLGAGSPQAYNVMATATNYLPAAIGGYLRLPRQWADSRPVDRGKTPLMILIDQLDLLGATMDKVFDAVCRADAEALVVHGRFLEEKFGAAAGGGDLRIGPTPLPPMPTTDAPSGPTPLTPPPGRHAG
jgi:hypothetical protein